MKVIKSDYSKNHYRVVERFPILPKRIFITVVSRRWVWLKKYYELQLDSYWGRGWISMEESFDKHEWDFKWDDKYLEMCGSNADKEMVKKKYPPNYKHSSIE